MILNMNKICFVGIDPAFRKSGFGMCIIDETNEASFKIFKSFLDFLNWIWEAPKKAFYCVENSNLQNKTFIQTGSRKELAKRSRDVGKNQAISQCTVDILIRMFGEQMVFGISPKQKGKKLPTNVIKGIAKQEKIELVNYRGTQDENDSFMLALKGKEEYKRICRKNHLLTLKKLRT